MVVQRRHDDELGSSGFPERLAQPDADLLERFEAIGGEPRRRHEHSPAPWRERAHDFVRERTQPTRSETRLERERPLAVAERELPRQRTRRPLALGAVWVAARDALLGEAVEADHVVLDRAVSARLPHAIRERAHVAFVLAERR